MLKSIGAFPLGLKFVGGTVSPPSVVRKTIVAGDVRGEAINRLRQDAARDTRALTSPASKR
jgi:hypothetical protein